MIIHKHTFRVLGIPHPVSSPEYNVCVYTQKRVTNITPPTAPY